MANIVLDIEKGVEVGAEDLYKWVMGVNSKAQNPVVITALGTLAGAIEKALADASGAAASPASLIVALPTDISDFKAVWPDVKIFLSTLGIKL